MAFPLAFLSLLVERLVGYPPALFGAIGHPVTWMGRLLAALDGGLNRAADTPGRRRAMGAVALALLLAAAMAGGLVLAALFAALPAALGLAGAALAGSSLLAQRSLYAHVEAVAAALETGGLAAGRRAVAAIVGRDPEALDEAGVARAAIESLAENFSDGVVAPALWLGLGGLAGGAAYKALNTADSMIGHRTPRHAAFGWAAARLDDLANLPASRLSALLLVAAARLARDGDADAAWQAVRRDAGRHRSPNAGWPEAAMAGALGLALAGPRSYHGMPVEDAVMGVGGRRRADAADIRRALHLCRLAGWLLVGLFALIAAALA
ncbi:adenosylcobinamide-phosphate synthase CbiB [Aquibium sp. A9E412]|uniref:adenosylcobinamide-phosphate synthase CbiB n=1 Tax=Aquibium sp. A9E412 TaxID=2976767 RepID=UPI0025AF94BF|nr:adenosylcobinamide-phosphate synthase CbiB [Aquibium sp. A9E412]MDN2565862.1 adenosylcobinamide-phosphate synthase CbiB [Aquibium sp. A9E412]